MGMQTGAATIESSIEGPQKKKEKVKTELPYNPAIQLLGIYLKKMKTLVGKDMYTTMFIAAFRITKIWKQAKCPSTDKWIKKKTHTQTQLTIFQP